MRKVLGLFLVLVFTFGTISVAPATAAEGGYAEEYLKILQEAWDGFPLYSDWWGQEIDKVSNVVVSDIIGDNSPELIFLAKKNFDDWPGFEEELFIYTIDSEVLRPVLQIFWCTTDMLM